MFGNLDIINVGQILFHIGGYRSFEIRKPKSESGDIESQTKHTNDAKGT